MRPVSSTNFVTVVLGPITLGGGPISCAIAAKFVRQLSKLTSNQYRSCTTGKDGPGGI